MQADGGGDQNFSKYVRVTSFMDNPSTPQKLTFLRRSFRRKHLYRSRPCEIRSRQIWKLVWTRKKSEKSKLISLLTTKFEGCYFVKGTLSYPFFMICFLWLLMFAWCSCKPVNVITFGQPFRIN